ncbi:MAG: hypothetical protein ACRYFX_14945 [Janthinobacterium lividum]
MPATLRVRQLRRDKDLFALVMNAIRLHLELHDRLAQQPHLREQPDADWLHLQQTAAKWLVAATAYVIRKHHTSKEPAMRAVKELMAELQEIPESVVRQVAVSAVQNFPDELLPTRGRPTQPNTAPGT